LADERVAIPRGCSEEVIDIRNLSDDGRTTAANVEEQIGSTRTGD
jgi:hypothetical protein